MTDARPIDPEWLTGDPCPRCVRGRLPCGAVDVACGHCGGTGGELRAAPMGFAFHFEVGCLPGTPEREAQLERWQRWACDRADAWENVARQALLLAAVATARLEAARLEAVRHAAEPAAWRPYRYDGRTVHLRPRGDVFDAADTPDAGAADAVFAREAWECDAAFVAARMEALADTRASVTPAAGWTRGLPERSEATAAACRADMLAALDAPRGREVIASPAEVARAEAFLAKLDAAAEEHDAAGPPEVEVPPGFLAAFLSDDEDAPRPVPAWRSAPTAAEVRAHAARHPLPSPVPRDPIGLWVFRRSPDDLPQFWRLRVTASGAGEAEGVRAATLRAEEWMPLRAVIDSERGQWRPVDVEGVPVGLVVGEQETSEPKETDAT